MKNTWFWTLSSVLIIGSFIVTALSLTIIFPWQLILRLLQEKVNYSFLSYLEIFLGGGAIIWCIFIYGFLNYYELKKNEKALEFTTLIKMDEYKNLDYCIQKLKEYGVYNITEYRLDGNNFNIIDEPEKSINETPRALNTLKKEARKPHVVIIPPRFWARFKNQPEALLAVLVHESAHFNNKDIALLFSLKRVLKIVSFIIISKLFISLIPVFYSFDFSNIVASVIGKTYFLFLIILIMLIYLTWENISIWREALADKEAIKICGINALYKAEKLLNNPNLISYRPSKNKVENALILTPRWILLMGFIIDSFANRSIGGLAYLKNEIVHDNFIQILLILQILSNLILILSLYIGFFYVLAVLIREGIDKRRNLTVTIGRSVFLLLLGSSLSFTLFEALPLALTSLFMPQGYDYINRVDVNFSFVFFAFFNSPISNSILMLIAVFGAWLAGTLKRFWVGILPGLWWATITSLELNLFPDLMQGKIAIISTLSLISFLLIYNRRHINFQGWRQPKQYIIFSFLLLLIAENIGYGDVGYLAACYNQTGHLKLQEQNITEAIYFFKKATEYAPTYPRSWMDLAIALQKDNKLREAAETADKAVFAFFNYNWQEKLETLYLASSLRLKLREAKDLEIAEKYFKQAENMWRKNSRLSSEVISSILYNIACLYAFRDKNTVESAIYLLEASLINPKIAVNAINDPDLSILNLRNQKSLSEQEKNFFKNLHNISAPILRELISKGELTETSLLHSVVFLAQVK